jgi:hypothetical protein
MLKELKAFWNSPLVMIAFAIWTGWYLAGLWESESSLVAWIAGAFLICLFI